MPVCRQFNRPFIISIKAFPVVKPVHRAFRIRQIADKKAEVQIGVSILGITDTVRVALRRQVVNIAALDFQVICLRIQPAVMQHSGCFFFDCTGGIIVIGRQDNIVLTIFRQLKADRPGKCVPVFIQHIQRPSPIFRGNLPVCIHPGRFHRDWCKGSRTIIGDLLDNHQLHRSHLFPLFL